MFSTKQLSAIGELEKDREVFWDASGFRDIPAPEAGDWLAEHPEKGQTFGQFQRASKRHVPDARRRKLYLLPLGHFDPDRSPSLEQLRVFASAFFMLPVVLLAPRPVDTGRIKSRWNDESRQQQLLASDILNWLKSLLPPDAFSLTAVTMADLYPRPAWNFVFGLASLQARVGVYSFARYHPAFTAEAVSADTATVLLRRCCKVMAHEMAHQFGLKHCVFFSCLMQGSNHLEESERKPSHLCPVCLRKLHAAVRFDPKARYRVLQAFYTCTPGFGGEAAWVACQLATWPPPRLPQPQPGHAAGSCNPVVTKHSLAPCPGAASLARPAKRLTTTNPLARLSPRMVRTNPLPRKPE